MAGAEIRQLAPVRDFLLDPSIYSRLRKIGETYNLPEERLDEFLDLCDAVIDGKLPLEGVPDMIATAFGVHAETARKIASDVVGYRLLPLDQYLPGVADHIASWGGKVSDYPIQRVQKAKESPDKFVEDLANKLGLKLPENLMQRFTYLASGYLTKERAADSTKSILMRKISLGGLEFTPPMVDKLFTLLDEEAKHYEFATPKPVAQPAPAPTERGRSAERVAMTNKSVPDHGLVKKAEPTISRLEFLRRMQKITIAAPVAAVKRTAKGVASVPKAAKMAISSEPILPASEAEKKINTILAPVVEQFKQRGLTAVAFRDTSVGYMKGERNDVQTKEHLIVAHGFSAEEAEGILSRLQKAKQAARLASTDESDQTPAIIAKRTPVQKMEPLPVISSASEHALTTSVPVISGINFDEDREEIERHRRTVEKQKATAGEADADLEARINAALQPAAEVFKAQNQPPAAFNDVARAAVRGIREMHQTESLLQERYKISGADLDRVMQSLEEARRIAEASNRSAENEPERPWLRSGKQLTQAEKELLDRRYAAVTGSVSNESVEPILPHAKVSAARTKEEELQLQKKGVSEDQIRQAQAASRPEQAKAKVSAGTVMEKNRKFTDVTFEQKLVGPVEELGTMKPAEFRRLAPDPKEATQKILDKLDLLEATSYEERIKGVSAWRKNPINSLYLKMSNDALKLGKSVAEIATERRNAGEETLSPTEVKAIVELNAKIKF